jgi:hypothetical protein
MYTVKEHVFIVKNYWLTNSVTATQRAFRREYGVRYDPDRKTILRLVEKLEETGSLQSEKGKHNPPSRVPQCAEDVRERLIRSPRKSLRRLSQEPGYSLTMCQTAAKHAKIKRVSYCNWFLRLVERNPGILTTWFNDEAWFHLSPSLYTSSCLRRKLNWTDAS